jgi:hypothetical protein
MYCCQCTRRLCVAPAPLTISEAGPNLALEQVTLSHSEVEASPEPEMGEREGQQEDSVEEAVTEDPEVGVVGAMEEAEVELGENVELSVLESEGDESEMGLDSRLEYWEWAHDWEDLDWSEEIWMEDERVSSDLNEAVLPDELWE